jgi:membrane-bound lytic murein transglycosylase D
MKISLLCLGVVFWLAGCAGTANRAPYDLAANFPQDMGPIARPALPINLPAALPDTPFASAAPAHLNTEPAANDPLMPISAAQASRLGVMQLAPPQDLWERIRRGYAMPDLESDLVHDREQWYATRPDYIFRMTERSRKYLFHIVEELELRNMPSELALLPFIESAFNPQAVSGAKAAGMWQFMPATGKHFELKQNAFRDDRRDVLASTRAALDYLQKLHGMFGDWHLALAAYNWGEGSVGRAIAKNKKAGLGTGYLDLTMPMETRFYVPKLQAVKNIVSGPDTFSAKLPLIENHPFFQPVTIKRDIDVALAAKLAEVSVEDFKALNPSANRPVILAAGTSQILLPWDNATIFQRNLQSHGASQMASWTVWVAPTTLKTADAAKRTGMSEAELRAINNIPPKVMIKAGSTLLVPRGGRIDHDVAVNVADNGQIGLAPEILARRTVIKAGKNESVASVAKRYSMTAMSVAEWNKVNVSAAFKSGQQVVLYLPNKGKAVAKAGSGGRHSKLARAAGSRSGKGATKVAKR